MKDSQVNREVPRAGQNPQEPISPCDIFEDAKKKLKLVLSNSEIHQLPESLPLVGLFIFSFPHWLNTYLIIRTNLANGS